MSLSRRELLGLGAFAAVAARTASAAAQVPPTQYPIQGRFVYFGYDKTIAPIGDLINPFGTGTVGQNNGIAYAFPSRNVMFRVDLDMWDVELGIWTGTDYTWVRTLSPRHQSAYYPEVPGTEPDTHLWLSEPADVSENFGDGHLRVHGYDGDLNIRGDSYQGKADDGVLFSLPFKSAHIIRNAGLWHGRLTVTNHLGLIEDVWAVYPTTTSHFDFV